MDPRLEKIARTFRETARPEWIQIKLFFEAIETGGICSTVTPLVLYHDQAPESIDPESERDENGDLTGWNYLKALADIWQSQTGSENKWYCATITIWPDGQVDFEPTSYIQPTFEDEYTIDGLIT